MSLEVTKQELLKQAIYLKKLYETTRVQDYKDQETRLRRIVVELDVLTIGTSNVATLNDLTDVTISAPANAQVLTYNSTTLQWENQTPAAGGGGDMNKSTYDVDNDGVVDSAETTQIIVRNSTGVTLTKGQVVYLSGATGNRPNALLSQADTEVTATKTIGIVVANINNNSDGYVAVSGTLHNLDTSAFADGVAVWLSATTAGGMTSTIPAEPNHTVFIGYIARAHPTQGRLVIVIQNGYELNELHGVLTTSEANNDLLTYESSTGLWKNKTFSAIFGGTPLVSVPTLAQVTTAGNTTTNAITVGGLTVNTNLIYTDTVNGRVGIKTTAPGYRLDVQGLAALDAVRSHIGFDLYTVPEPTTLSAVVSAGGSVDTGLHGYYITFITALGETRSYGALSVTTTAGNNTVTLTIPVSSDPRVTGRKIYRTKTGSSVNEYILTTINNNTATTYVDTAADSTLTLEYRGATYRANTTNNQFTLNGQKAMLLDFNATYFGIQAGQAITSGGQNVFVGFRAGYSSTTGLSNTFIGYLSAPLKTTGDNNVVIGTTASYNATTLNQNVVLGTNAGRYHTGGSANITSMTSSVFIGMRSYAASATPSNTIVIGYQAESLGDNTVVLGNSSIVTTALRGNVLIGTTTDAGYKLDVNGTARITSNAIVSGTLALGTTSPAAKYHQYQTQGIMARYDISNANADQNRGVWDFYTNAGVAPDFFGRFGFKFEGGTADSFKQFQINVASSTIPSMVVTGGGLVGIGTIAPTYRVDVQGTTLATSSVSVQGAFNINPLAAPPVIGGFTLSAGTNLGVGQYYYFVVYVTAIGETSAGTPLSVVTTAGNTTVNLTGIPVSTDPRVTARKIYRTKLGGAIDNQWFLATISDNVTTTYTDSATDASLTGANLQSYKVNTTARYFTVSGTQGMVIDQNLTALGRSAGNAIITSNATAVRTVLIGAQAGQNITTGKSNVIVGVAGVNVTTGSENSLFGDLAGYNLNTGNGNTIIGSQSGRFLTSGYNNIFIGPAAGSLLADGTTQVTTAFQNIAIGRNARMSTINDSNSIIIGDTALGLGSNTTVIGNSSTTFTSIPAGNMTVGGTTNAGYKLDVNGTFRTNDRAYVGEDVTFTSAQYYYLISGSADGLVTFTNSTVNQGQAQGLLTGELYLAGTAAFLNHRGINIITTNRNTHTSNIVRAFYASGRTGQTGAANTVAGFLGGVNIEGSGNVTNAIGLEVEILSQTNNKTITNMYGVKVQPLVNSVGTITNTYGIYIDSLTAGTQTNAAYGIYQAGTNRNYFGGNVLIGTTTDTGEKLQVNGVVRATSFSIGATAGWTGTINIMTNPPGQQNIDVQGGIIVNVF